MHCAARSQTVFCATRLESTADTAQCLPRRIFPPLPASDRCRRRGFRLQPNPRPPSLKGKRGCISSRQFHLTKLPLGSVKTNRHDLPRFPCHSPDFRSSRSVERNSFRSGTWGPSERNKFRSSPVRRRETSGPAGDPLSPNSGPQIPKTWVFLGKFDPSRNTVRHDYCAIPRPLESGVWAISATKNSDTYARTWAPCRGGRICLA